MKIGVAVYVVDATTGEQITLTGQAGNPQIRIASNLVAGRSYFMVVAAADITTQESFIDFTVQKIA